MLPSALTYSCSYDLHVTRVRARISF